MRIGAPGILALDSDAVRNEPAPPEGFVLQRPTRVIEFDVPPPPAQALEESVVFLAPAIPSAIQVSSSELLYGDEPEDASWEAESRPRLGSEGDTDGARPLIGPDGRLGTQSSRAAVRARVGMLALAIVFGIVAVRIEATEAVSKRAARRLERSALSEAPRPDEVLLDVPTPVPPTVGVAHSRKQASHAAAVALAPALRAPSAPTRR
jgi:hypothetical protein